jgi:hypothetical protein
MSKAIVPVESRALASRRPAALMLAARALPVAGAAVALAWGGRRLLRGRSQAVTAPVESPAAQPGTPVARIYIQQTTITIRSRR